MDRTSLRAEQDRPESERRRGGLRSLVDCGVAGWGLRLFIACVLTVNVAGAQEEEAADVELLIEVLEEYSDHKAVKTLIKELGQLKNTVLPDNWARNFLLATLDAVRAPRLDANLDEARFLFEQSILLMDEYGKDSYRTSLRQDFARYLVKRGLYSDAIPIIDAGLELAGEYSKAWLYLTRSEANICRQRWAGALDDLRAAGAAIGPDTVSLREARCQLHLDLSEYFRRHGVIDGARCHLSEASRFLTDESDPSTLARFHRRSIAIHLADGDDEQAVELVNRLLNQHPKLYRAGTQELNQLLIDKGGALRALSGRRSDGKEMADEARECLNVVLRSNALSGADRVRALFHKVRLELQRDGWEAAYQGLAELHSALDVIEREEGTITPNHESLFRGLQTWHALATSSDASVLRTCRDNLRDALRRRMASWMNLAIKPGGAGFTHFLDHLLILGKMIEVELALDPGPKGVEAAFRILMEAHSAGAITRHLTGLHETWAPTIEEVRNELLPSGHGLLQFLPTDEGAYVFLIDNERLLLERIETSLKSRLEHKRGEFLEAVRTRAGNEDGVLRELAAMCVPDSFRPVIRSWKGLTASGFDLIGNTPVDILPICGTKPVGLMMPVTTLPTVPLGMALKKTHKDSRARVLQFLAPRHGSHSRTLDEQGDIMLSGALSVPEAISLTGEEWAALHSALGSVPQAMLREEGATKDALLEGLKALPRLLHILTHGVHKPSRGERTGGLVVAPSDWESADSGFLWCEDIEKFDFAPDVTILTSCETMRAPQRSGDDGKAHLGGAFFVAGSKVVVQSFLPVELHRMIALSSRMISYIAEEGRSPAEALWKARVELIDKYPDLMTLGLIQVIGDGNRTFFPSPNASDRSSWWLAAFVGAIAMGLLAMALINRRMR